MLQTYVPLYRKYRPQSFQDLVGQGAISQTLTNAILHNRVAHAYLFTGPRGTGKTSSARILAKSLNCERGPTPQPCGVCSSCHDITSGTALDVIEIDAASNRSVEDARDLIDRVQFAPVSGRYKVYIIDEVHMLTPQAFNTLLKTLEEPPPNLVFILATTEAHKVLETIISRCQRFDFRRISQDSMVNRLREISDKENIKINKEALNLIARRSAGGLRDALGLLDQISVLSDVKQQIEIKDVLSLIGALPEDMLIKISDGIAKKDGAYVLQIINELMTLGSEPLQIVKELTIHFRNLLIASTVKDNLKDIIDASEEFFDDLKKIAATFEQVEIAQIIDRLSYAERMVRNSSQPILWLEVGMLSICYRHEIAVVTELQKRVDELERIVASGNFSSAQNAPDVAFTYQPRSLPKPEKIEKVVQKQDHAAAEEKEQAVTIQKEAKPLIKEDKSEEALQPLEEEKDSHPKPEIRIPEVQSQEIKEIPASVELLPVDKAWQDIINAITHTPTKGMLSSLAMPMAITKEEVVIGFSQEIFINQMKQDNRMKPLNAALEKVLSKVPKVVFKLLSEQEFKSSETKQVVLESPPEKKIDKIVAPVPSVVEDKIADKTKGDTELDETSENGSSDEGTVAEKQLDVMLSEQAEIVKDIFQGKILNI